MSLPVDRGGSPPPDLKLAPNFPGLTGDDGGGPYVDHHEVRAIVSRVRKQVQGLLTDPGARPSPSMSATYSGPGTVGEVAGMGGVGPDETGKWEVADYFGQNISRAYDVFGGSYSELVTYVEKWADAVEKAIDNYEKGHADSSA
ncbi:hypothetical protein [Nonomuraea helvata]|uniref:PE domain-containing protein n=1 Tax=Nonomuraea helvata TaxID=37484 RepID=A0ABV5RSG0_9ACTN